MKRFVSHVVLFAALALATAPALAEQWGMDESHTAVIFKVQHYNGTSNQYGRFNEIFGSMNTGDSASFEFVVKADSIDTNNAKRDDHLRSPDFFNTRQFPTITFAGSSITSNDEGMELAGDLTLHGVTHPLTVQLTKVGESETRDGGRRIGLETTFTIKRSDFGMDKMIGPVGDEVTLTISFEALSQ